MNSVASTTVWGSLRYLRLCVLFALLCITSGCMATGSGPTPASASFGPTVAFESVDGPPPQVFDRLVRALETESAGRSFTVVSREAGATYRVRSYLSAQVERGKTTIAWVWDVYDRDQQRALRLSGEEPAGKAGRDAWSAADDQMMRKIAQAGLGGLSAVMSGAAAPVPDAPIPAAPSSGPAIAQADSEQTEPTAETTALAFSAH
ncbi:hypothetical protein V1291_001986 [Nitrobacteraceae bacterium AZCC 1564]